MPDRDPGEGEVRITVEAVSVNGFDVAVAAGHVWDALPHADVIDRQGSGRVTTVRAAAVGLAGVSALDALAELPRGAAQARRPDGVAAGRRPGSGGSGRRHRHELSAAPKPEKLTTLLEAVAAGTLQVPVAATYPMEEAGKAFRELSTSKLAKIVLTVP